MEPRLAGKPLTEIQSAVLAAVFRDRRAGPRSIARDCDIKVSVVRDTLSALRTKKYLVHDRRFKHMGTGNASYRPLKTLDGELIPEFTPEESQALVAIYLRTHRVKKLQCGSAENICRGDMWGKDL